MKENIKTLHDALIFQLQGLYYAEIKLKENYQEWMRTLHSPALIRDITEYIGSTEDKLLKLERVFNYLMKDDVVRRNEVVNKLIEETQLVKTFQCSPHLKDILVISNIENINAYKISGYKTAYLFAIEMELDTVADLLQQILEWETETRKSLYSLAINEFNKLEGVTS